MDPATTANLLGAGSAQVVLAVGVVALALVSIVLAKALWRSYNDRLTETRETMTQQSADSRAAAETLRDLTRTIEMALAALRGPR